MSKSDLMAVLNVHEDLVRSCATGEVGFTQFCDRYGDVYASYALDGHESSAEEREVLRGFESRVSLHRAIFEQVLCHLTSDELVNAPGAREAGFIGSEEGFQRLCAIWHDWRSRYVEEGNV